MTLPRPGDPDYDCSQFGPHDCAGHTPCQTVSRAGDRFRMLEPGDVAAGMGFPPAASALFAVADGAVQPLSPVTVAAVQRGLDRYNEAQGSDAR